jgi:two-component system response regulator DegU
MGRDSMSVIRVMIAESDSTRAQTYADALSKQESLDIVSTVTTREAALKQLATSLDIVLLNPDVLKKYSLSGFLHAVQAASPHTRVVHLLTLAPLDEKIISDIKTGIRGFIKISDPPASMLKAIHAVHRGEIWAERRILEKAISKSMLLPETLQAHVSGLPPLTNREREMLTLVLQGASNKEIADKSSISERTVKTHLYRVYRKLNVKSRTKAIALFSR